MRTSQCRGCGKPIVWAFITRSGERLLNKDGTPKRVPLDPRPVVYRIKGGFDAAEYEAEAITQADGLVNHFATCSAAGQFSGKNRKKETQTSDTSGR